MPTRGDMQGMIGPDGQKPLHYASARGQLAVMLLAALRELLIDGFSDVTRRQATDFISRRGWFALKPEDHQPYPSQPNEPRWKTLIAWTRKDSVIGEVVSYDEWNAWGLTRRGREDYDRLLGCFRRGILPVAPCYLWSSAFKRFLLPEYAPSRADASRPRSFYDDIRGTTEKQREKARALLASQNLAHFLAEYRKLVGKDPGNWVPTRNAEYNEDHIARLLAEYSDASALKALLDAAP